MNKIKESYMHVTFALSALLFLFLIELRIFNFNLSETKVNRKMNVCARAFSLKRDHTVRKFNICPSARSRIIQYTAQVFQPK